MVTELSVVVPMYNEASNVADLLSALDRTLDASGMTSEIILVDDGSTDSTRKMVERLSSDYSRVKLISYTPNRGRGYALRRGFDAARGSIIVTAEADLSYDPKYVVKLAEALEHNPGIDIVIGSPYGKGGHVAGVPLWRLLISRVGNRILSYALSSRLTTVTGMLRAYRCHVPPSLDLESERKEIHLEILSEAIARGYKVSEIPVSLRGRRKGKSKLKLGRTIASHLRFCFDERPSMLFGSVGLAMILLALVLGGGLMALWIPKGRCEGGISIVIFLLLLVAGVQSMLVGFLATKLAALRKGIRKLHYRAPFPEDGEHPVGGRDAGARGKGA